MSHCCRALLLVLLSLCTAHHGSAVESGALDRHSERALTLLRDAISRQTVHGEGNVPAYAESLREVILSAGFEPESLTLVPYRDTASLVVR